MYSFLLKKALPFTLTFVFGAALGGFFGLFGHSGKKAEFAYSTRNYEFGSHCRMRSHNLVAESKPLVILFKPDARLPREFGMGDARDSDNPFPPAIRSALVRVTFGADGKVQAVEPFYEEVWGIDRLPLRLNDRFYKEAWENVEQAARLIKFTPETKDGVPVTVTKELEIFFFRE